MKKLLLLLALATTLCQLPARADEPTPRWFTADLQDPNTLGVLLSSQIDDTETLASVQYLRLSGTLGSDDITLIKDILTGLVEVDMLNVNLTKLPDELFNNDNNRNKHLALRRVVLPATLTDTGRNTFYYCSNLQEVVLPPTLSYIGRYAFFRCTSLAAFDFANTQISTIDEYAFMYSAIAEAIFPNTLTKIDNQAFESCRNLTSVQFPEYLESIGSYAFQSCTSLETVTVPRMGTMYGYIFNGCTSLREVTLPEGLHAVWSAMFRGCTSLTAIDIPGSVKRIGTSAFSGCTALAEVTLHEGLKEIGQEAFYDCRALTSLTLPSTMLNIFYRPFSSSGIQTLTCKAYMPCYVNNGLWNGNPPAACVLRVPQASLASYKTADGWNTFTTYEAIDDYMPGQISTFKEISFVSPADQPADWKPEVSLLCGENAITLYGNSSNPVNYEYGRLRVLGEEPLNISTLNLWTNEYDRRSNASSSDDRYACFYSQVIPRAAVTADRVNLNISFCTPYTSHWHFIAFPFDVDLADHHFSDEGHYYAIYRYDSSLRADGQNGWVRVADDGRLNAGEGYIISLSGYVNGTSTNKEALCFHSDAPVAINGDDVTIDLVDYPSDYAQNAGWNFIGNPYMSYFDSRFIDFDGPITVRTATSTSSSSYRAYSLTDDSYILVPGEAFFVQRSLTAEQMVFDKAGQQFNKKARDLSSSAPQRIKPRNADRILVNLLLSDGERTDHTRVVLNPEASAAYEPRCDAAKFMAEDATMPQLWSIADGVDYAINELPLPAGDIALGTRIASAGRYSIALEQPVDGCTVELIDHKTGRTVNLADEDCLFDAEDGDSPERFALRLTPGVTGLESLTGDRTAGDDSWYSLQGIRLKGEPTAAGIYIHAGKKVIVK